MSKEMYEFQAETKKLLDLMVHSIYTNHEIFLRELISNASDAIDKVRFEGLTDHNLLADGEDYEIYLLPDAESKTLTISDNGIGMTREEVMENLGTIAKSGTKAFLEKMKEKVGEKEAAEGEKKEENETTDKDLIGQFGVGFYSAFMVADKVTVITKRLVPRRRPAGNPMALELIRLRQRRRIPAGQQLYCTFSMSLPVRKQRRTSLNAISFRIS